MTGTAIACVMKRRLLKIPTGGILSVIRYEKLFTKVLSKNCELNGNQESPDIGYQGHTNPNLPDGG
jgi:hypothetical protein